MAGDLLVIYDDDDWLMRTAKMRSGVDRFLAVSDGLRGLQRGLDGLVAQKATFQRCVFHCHGNVGMIFFGDEKGNKQLDVDRLKKDFTGRGYHQIFPAASRIYFNGCQVSSGNQGWDFLETAGSIFLRNQGGETFAHTSDGYPLIPPALMIFGGLAGLIIGGSMAGHMPHVAGDARSLKFGPGARVLQRVGDLNAAPKYTPNPMYLRPPV